MKRTMIVLVSAMCLVLLAPTASFAVNRKNCGPGKFVLVHWHNYKKGYVDVYWGRTQEAIVGSPKADGTFNVGNHSRHTGLSNAYWGLGRRSLSSVDKAWVTCTSAV